MVSLQLSGIGKDEIAAPCFTGLAMTVEGKEYKDEEKGRVLADSCQLLEGMRLPQLLQCPAYGGTGRNFPENAGHRISGTEKQTQ